MENELAERMLPDGGEPLSSDDGGEMNPGPAGNQQQPLNLRGEALLFFNLAW